MSKPETLTTYSQLRDARDMFMADSEALELVIIGLPGIGKTQAFKRSLGKEGDDFGYINGNVTAFDLYRQLWTLKDLPIVIDDVDDALTDAKKRTLFKSAMEGERRKVIKWGSATKALVDEWGNDIPMRFATTSNFCIIVNQLTATTSNHLKAILSRAYVIKFEPATAEVHRYVGEWFKDREVYDFVGQWLPLIRQPDIRLYELARKMRFHGRDWRAFLLNNWLESNRDVAAIIQLLNNPNLPTLAEKAQRYAIQGKSAREFLTVARRLLEMRNQLATFGIKILPPSETRYGLQA